MHGSRIHYHVRDPGEPSESVWRVRKDYIILLVAYLQPVSHVQAVDSCFRQPHGAQGFADEFVVAPVNLYNINLFRSP